MSADEVISMVFKISSILHKPCNRDKQMFEVNGVVYSRDDVEKYYDYLMRKLNGSFIPDPYLSLIHHDISKRKKISRREYQRHYQRDYIRLGHGSQKTWGITDKIPKRSRGKRKKNP